ncbi:MAG: WbqC family protein [Eubacteriales bacterium]|nr:WbqC family protein [Eubacteriales bacterium]
MKAAMMQPSFLPWQGFFELILKSDIFILLDDFQFSAQSYHQRNRLFLNKDQIGWYTVPVMKRISFLSPLNQVKIDGEPNWRIKMWKRIQSNYAKAPFYNDLAPWLETWLLGTADNIAAQNIAFIQYVSKLLNYKGEFRYSSELPSDKVRSERVEELLRWCNAAEYLCARGSFEYMLLDGVFPLKDISVSFQDFKPLPYRQIGNTREFIPYLSILDALMNIGPEKTEEYVKSGTKKWLLWDEMKSIVPEDSIC